MNRRHRAVIAAIIAAAISLAALPASADTTATATFSGNGAVGKWFMTTCDKRGVGTPTGRGLYFPFIPTIPGFTNGDDTREEDGVWRFSGTGTADGSNQQGIFAGAFAIAACGHLGPVADAPGDNRLDGVGANCFTHKGHHGQGNATFPNGQRVKLYELGWKKSAGGVIPISGKYQEYLNDTGDLHDPGNKKDKHGTVAGTLWVMGGAACTGLKAPVTNDGNGAQHVTLTGELEFVNTGDVEPPTPPKTTQKYCKNSGPAAGRDGVKKTHDNKPGRHPCTPADGGDKS